MKRIYMLILLVILPYAASFGQNLLMDSDVIQKDRRVFFFDGFTGGSVVFKDGTRSSGDLNYNLLSQKIQFRQDDKVLDLSTPASEIDYVQIANLYFIPYQNEFLVAIERNNVALLYSRSVFLEGEKIGAYNTENTTGAQDNMNALDLEQGGSFGMVYLLPQTKIKITERFYLRKNNKTVIATKKNYLKLYPEIKPQIEEFLSQHKVNFNNEADLRGLSKYCDSLMFAK